MPLFVVEVFSRNSTLVDACRAVGLASCGIGWYNSLAPSSCKVQLNLALPWAQSLVFQLISCKESSAFPWISLPCGSLSKARNRPLPPEWVRAGVPAAPQLRSLSSLWGLPSATTDAKTASKLFEANILIEFTFELVRRTIEAHKDWVVCNPKGSFLWDFPCWHSIKYFEVEFDKCAFGGSRPAPVVLRTSCKRLCDLARRCDGKHKHTPWKPVFSEGVFKSFSAPKDTFLPQEMCELAAKLIKEGLTGAVATPSGMSEVFDVAAKIQAACVDENKRKVALSAAAAGRQARGKRVERLIT